MLTLVLSQPFLDELDNFTLGEKLVGPPAYVSLRELYGALEGFLVCQIFWHEFNLVTCGGLTPSCRT